MSKRTCVVTGGSVGIGRAIVDGFVSQGYQVFNLDIQDTPSPKSDDEYWLECDMSDADQVNQAIDKVLASAQTVDVLVSNAGIHFSGNIENTTEQELQKVFDINVKGAFFAIQACLPNMKSKGQGAIVLLASDQALIGKKNSFAYNLSKSALASMAKTTALDYAQFNIRANAVCPGTIDTPLYHKAINHYVEKSGADIEQVHAEEAALQPLGRLGRAEEVASLVCFLASDDAAFITGSLQVIDGGYTAQ